MHLRVRGPFFVPHYPEIMTAPEPFAALFPQKYVSLTTFRKTGEGVPTTVWAAPAGDALYVTTLGSSGKVKRIRNNPDVTLKPSSMTGRVKAAAEAVRARAEIVVDPAEILIGDAALEAKYGWQYRMGRRSDERRTKGRGGASDRVILKITGI